MRPSIRLSQLPLLLHLSGGGPLPCGCEIQARVSLAGWSLLHAVPELRELTADNYAGEGCLALERRQTVNLGLGSGAYSLERQAHQELR